MWGEQWERVDVFTDISRPFKGRLSLVSHVLGRLVVALLYVVDQPFRRKKLPHLELSRRYPRDLASYPDSFQGFSRVHLQDYPQRQADHRGANRLKSQSLLG